MQLGPNSDEKIIDDQATLLNFLICQASVQYSFHINLFAIFMNYLMALDCIEIVLKLKISD